MATGVGQGASWEVLEPLPLRVPPFTVKARKEPCKVGMPQGRKLTDEQRDEIRRRTGLGQSATDIAAAVGVGVRSVHTVRSTPQKRARPPAVVVALPTQEPSLEAAHRRVQTARFAELTWFHKAIGGLQSRIDESLEPSAGVPPKSVRDLAVSLGILTDKAIVTLVELERLDKVLQRQVKRRPKFTRKVVPMRSEKAAAEGKKVLSSE